MGLCNFSFITRPAFKSLFGAQYKVEWIESMNANICTYTIYISRILRIYKGTIISDRLVTVLRTFRLRPNFPSSAGKAYLRCQFFYVGGCYNFNVVYMCMLFVVRGTMCVFSLIRLWSKISCQKVPVSEPL